MPTWLDPLLDAAEMRETDRWAIEEEGVPSLELMEAAGRALAEATASLLADRQGREGIAVVCGGGNNGGDGLVAARHLHELGLPVEVALIADPERLSTDAAANLRRLPDALPRKIGATADEVQEMAGRSSLLIDALLGTGFKGEPREPVASVIRALNEADAPVVAADIPSGVDASNGEAALDPNRKGRDPDPRPHRENLLATRADLTVTFHRAKIGHFVAPGKRLCGDVVVAPIGIPQGGPDTDPPAGRILPRVLETLPRRHSDSTKFSSGQVVVVGGSRGLTGAVCLAAEAAIRAGAGYATVAVPADLETVFEQKLTEVMSTGCAGPSGRFGEESVPSATRACRRAAAVVLGPGAGREPETLAFIREVARHFEGPLVVDADGLAAFNGDGLRIPAARKTTVLTPHEGELARLLGRSSASIARHRLAAAKEVAARSGSVVVLKGDDTVVTDGERVAINAVSAPALATAGTGDVLAGVVGAFLARLDDPFQAAAAAVSGHARAGRAAAEEVGLAESVIASDVIAALPRGLRR